MLLADTSIRSLTTAIELARKARFELAIRRDNGSFEGLIDAIVSSSSAATGLRVVAELRRKLLLSPGDLVCGVLEELFRFPSRYDLASRMETLHGISAAMLNVELKHRGLKPFHVLRRCARLAAAYALLQNGTSRLDDIAHAVGCGSIDSLARDTRLVAAISPGRLREVTDEAELVATLVHAAIRSPSAHVRHPLMGDLASEEAR